MVGWGLAAAAWPRYTMTSRESPAADQADVDWDAVLSMTGLDRDDLQSAKPTLAPQVFATANAAWVGAYAGGDELRVEAAAGAWRAVDRRRTRQGCPVSRGIDEAHHSYHLARSSTAG